MPVGDWSENKMHGQGFYTYASGDMYTGCFQQGVKHGQGSYYFKVTSSIHNVGCSLCMPSVRAVTTFLHRLSCL